MATNTNNYENIDYSKFTIDDIDINNNKPIRVGYSYTIKGVFDGLNKIIKAIVNKFKSIDTEMTNRINEVNNRFLGKTGTITFPAQKYSYNSSNPYQIPVPLDKTYTYGFVNGGGLSRGLDDWVHMITLRLYPEISSLNYLSDGKGGRANLNLELQEDKLIATINVNQYYSPYDPSEPITIQYELY